jgi:hypothetical protein
VVPLQRGEMIEAAMIGRDGIAAVPLALPPTPRCRRRLFNWPGTPQWCQRPCCGSLPTTAQRSATYSSATSNS